MVAVRVALVRAAVFAVTAASALRPQTTQQVSLSQQCKSAALAAAIVATPLSAFADGQTEKFKLPPVNVNDKSRCKFVSSAMGQANGARDKLIDLRQCDMTGKTADGFDLAGGILSDADFSSLPCSVLVFGRGV